MTKECKQARNVVLIPIVLLVSILVFLSSCGSSHSLCDAYALSETEVQR